MWNLSWRKPLRLPPLLLSKVSYKEWRKNLGVFVSILYNLIIIFAFWRIYNIIIYHQVIFNNLDLRCIMNSVVRFEVMDPKSHGTMKNWKQFCVDLPSRIQHGKSELILVKVKSNQTCYKCYYNINSVCNYAKCLLCFLWINHSPPVVKCSCSFRCKLVGWKWNYLGYSWR